MPLKFWIAGMLFAFVVGLVVGIFVSAPTTVYEDTP
jgi:flagellar biosynthesis protein FliQ